MPKLPNMKPFFTENFQSIIFDELENPIEHHPIIIFTTTEYDEKTDDYCENYYYIKVRSAYKKDVLKDPKKGEVLISKTAKGCLKNDSYADTTKIYHIKDYELEKFANIKKIANIDELKHKDIANLYSHIHHNLSQNPPYITLIKTEFNKENNLFKGTTEYCNEELLEQSLKYNVNKINENLLTKQENTKKIAYLQSLKHTIKDKRNPKKIDFIHRLANHVNGVWSSYYQEKLHEEHKNIVKKHYPNGKLWSETSYINGLKNGIEKTFYDNGQLKSETVWTNSKKDGTEKHYDNKGQLTVETTYLNGEKNGYQFEYNEQGILAKEIFYSKNKVKTIKQYKNYLSNQEIEDEQKKLKNQNKTPKLKH